MDPNSGPQVEEPSPEALVYGPFYTKPIPQDILSITILKSDPLKVRHWALGTIRNHQHTA